MFIDQYGNEIYDDHGMPMTNKLPPEPVIEEFRSKIMKQQEDKEKLERAQAERKRKQYERKCQDNKKKVEKNLSRMRQLQNLEMSLLENIQK